MGDPDKQVVDLITEMLTDYQSQEEDKLPLFAGFIDNGGNVHFGYVNCNYNDLYLISTASNDEAILRMLAVNQDRLQRFIEEVESEDDSEQLE